jgi:CTP:molybdopterin cytidylyltransferase MocA
MGRPKALLTAPGGSSFIVTIAQTLAAAGLDDIVVVTGVHHDAIAGALAASPGPTCRLVRNPRPERGQLSSLLCGLDAVDAPGTEAILVTLVDVPGVAVPTVASVAAAWQARRATIVRPAADGRHGHPVIFDRRAFGALRAAPLDLGAKSVVRAFAGEVENVEVEDRGCLIDVDTPEDYEKLSSS